MASSTTTALALLVYVCAVCAVFGGEATELYASGGSDWNGTCADGMEQSPINIVTADVGDSETYGVQEATVLSMAPELLGYLPLEAESVADMKESVFHVYVNETQWLQQGYNTGALSKLAAMLGVTKEVAQALAEQYVGDPLQMHFHALSEHTVDGVFAACEGHLVCSVPCASPADEVTELGEYEEEVQELTAAIAAQAIADVVAAAGTSAGNDTDGASNQGSCLRVFGQMYNLGAFNGALEALIAPFEAAVLETGGDGGGGSDDEAGQLPATLDVPALYGGGGRQRTFWEYGGSLTTPPCSEPVRFVIFEPLPDAIAPDQLVTMQNIIGEVGGQRANNRIVQPLNNRTVLHVDAAALM